MLRELGRSLALILVGFTFCGAHAAAVQTGRLVEIELQLGGEFQSTTFHLSPEGVLSYHHADERGSTRDSAALTAADIEALNRLIGEFDLRAMQSDRPAFPDAPFYRLVISQDAAPIRLYCWMPENRCSVLAERLKDYFQARLSGPGSATAR